MTPIAIVAVIFVAIVLSFVLLVVSAERARLQAWKYGGIAPYRWWLYGRHVDFLSYRVIGRIKCFFSGHKPWKVFIWSMSGPGESYMHGSCSRCYGVYDLEHPIPMNDQEQIAWLEDNYPGIYIFHLGDHSWGSAHREKGDVLNVVSIPGNITESKPGEYGGPPTGRMDCFFYVLKAEKNKER